MTPTMIWWRIGADVRESRSSFVRIAGPKRVLSVLVAREAALLVVLIFQQEIRDGLAFEFID
jgi:hypothetical protein